MKVTYLCLVCFALLMLIATGPIGFTAAMPEQSTQRTSQDSCATCGVPGSQCVKYNTKHGVRTRCKGR